MFSRAGILFLCIGFLIWGIFSYPVFKKVGEWSSYTALTPAKEVEWSIQPIHDELWRPVAHFKYAVGENEYEKKEVFLGGRFRTPYAAEMAIKNLQNEYQTIWYDPLKPNQATLENFFPLKKLVYALTVLALLIYGSWLFSYFQTKTFTKGEK